MPAMHYPYRIACFLMWFCWLGQANAQNIDINLLKTINVNRNPRLDGTFTAITHSVTPVSIALPVIMTGAGLLKKDKTLRNKGYEMGASLLITTGFTFALKYGINRPRPFATYPFVDNVLSPGDPSFPSGHTSAAFHTATMLSLQFPKWYVIAPSFAWAGLAGYSRMHLGVHYPSDVLAGAVIGAGTAFLTHQGTRWLQRRGHKSSQRLQHTGCRREIFARTRCPARRAADVILPVPQCLAAG